MLRAAERSDELNGVENARKEDSCVEDCKKEEDAEEAALGLDS